MAHGCYRALLDGMWKMGGRISTDRKILWWIARCSSLEQYLEVADLVEACFTRSEDGLWFSSETLTEEWDSATAILEKRRDAGSKGGSSKREANATAKPKQSPSTPLASSSSSTEQKTEERPDSTQDGSLQFENSMALYPEKRRDYSNLSQGQYFKAIGEIRQIHGCTSSEAVARLDKHIAAFVAKEGDFCPAFLKYLDSKPWKVAPAAPKIDQAAKDAAEESRLLKVQAGLKAQKEALRASIKANQA